MLVKGRNRKDEFEADEHSLNYLQAHNYSLILHRYLNRLDTGEKTSKLEYLNKTHPPLKKRVDKLIKLTNQKKVSINDSDIFFRKQRFEFIKSLIN